MEVAQWIDRQKVGSLQILVFLVSGAATLLDGFDAQAIGYVAPAIIKDWHIPAVALSGVFSAGTFGILLGCLLVAPLALAVFPNLFGARVTPTALLLWFLNGFFWHTVFSDIERLMTKERVIIRRREPPTLPHDFRKPEIS